jgi:two-component system response regulator GlrR
VWIGGLPAQQIRSADRSFLIPKQSGPAQLHLVTTHYIDVKKRTVVLAGARLVVLKGPDRGRALRITKELISIGTAPSCDLVLTDDTVSAHHLSVRVLQDSYLATDLESTNGTFAGGCRIRSADLQTGDTIDVGRTRVRLEPVAEATELPLSQSTRFGRLLGRSAESRRLFALLEAVAAQDVTVLLVGETGTGKDLAAQAIHETSARAEKPFVVVDCSAISPALIEAELFGHERGAFTGADRSRDGAFLEADGGTIFFDEISKLPFDMQPKLLRALENREVRPLGAARPSAFDARVIAASDSDLRVAVNRGTFRADLLYRLNVVTIAMPPLRERPDDIPLLANHFYQELTRVADAVLPLAKLTSLLQHTWPGNVRELRNAVDQWVTLSGLALEPEVDDAPESYRAARARAVAAFERRFLWPLMVKADGNVSLAARLASMDRVNLIKLLRKHGLVARAVAGSAQVRAPRES